MSSYWDSVQSIATEAKTAEKDGQDINEFVHESVDGSQWIIYTGRNLECLKETSNEDAAFDQQGSDALDGCKSASAVYARLAFYAMQADVYEAIAELPNEEEEEED